MSLNYVNNLFFQELNQTKKIEYFILKIPFPPHVGLYTFNITLSCSAQPSLQIYGLLSNFSIVINNNETETHFTLCSPYMNV